MRSIRLQSYNFLLKTTKPPIWTDCFSTVSCPDTSTASHPFPEDNQNVTTESEGNSRR